MTKLSVKKPYTVLVAVVMLIVLGIVSFTKLTTDLLPTISLPYIMVITTYPGASPERVESDVTEPLEASLGTVNGVENVNSTSSENYSMVILEFQEDTNMDSAMVKVSTAVDQTDLPETAGRPSLIEISPDLMATMYAAVDYEGYDIYALTDFAKDTVIPYLERQSGVASVEATGLVEKSVEIRLDQTKIDRVNARVLGLATDKLEDAQAELDDAKKDLKDAKSDLESGKKKLENEQDKTSKELAEYSKMLDEAMATKAAYAAQLVGLETNQKALQAEKKAYEDNKLTDTYDQLNNSFTLARQTLSSQETYQKIYDAIYLQVQIGAVQAALAQMGMTDVTVTAENLPTYMAMMGDAAAQIQETAAQTAAEMTQQQIAQQMGQIPVDIKDALDNPDKLKAFRKMLKEQGQEEAAENMTKKNLQKIYDIVAVRMPQIDTELANLEIEIQVAKTVKEEVEKSIKEAEDAYVDVEAGKITAAASFGAYTAQMQSGLAQIESGEEQLDSAQEQIDESRENALKSANLDQLLNMDTMSKLLTAQNFSMPAGYIVNDDDSQILVKIGDEFDAVEQIEDMLLVHLDEIGDVRIGDVAYVTELDTSMDTYAKVNGRDAVILSVSKSSTAGTSDVSKACNKAMKELEKRYPGLHLTALMDQGDYIKMIVNSVLSNLIWGALLAIIVLALFLKDYKPTIVVAFSIPMSVLFAVVLMYFTDITLNIISLSGLALGIGMLVDNSIVVIENIYRLRNKGIPAARAAVMGAKQVAGAIAASTLTTICVFVPITFTSGLARQLFTDMALTIGYSLIASLIVALSFVPCMSATVLKNTKEKSHKLFDGFIALYEKLLRLCLRFKWAPLTLAVLLLVFCIIRVLNTGMIMLPQMGGNQMSMNITVSDDMTVEDGYRAMDDLMEQIMGIEGVATVGIMSGGGSGDMMLSSGTNKDMSIMLLLEDEAGKDNTVIADRLEKMMQESAYADLEYSIATSNMDISALIGSGLEIEIYGDDLDMLLAISNDMMELLSTVEGFEDISNGQQEGDIQYVVTVDKDKAMRSGLTVAQIFAEISGKLTTEKDSVILTTQDDEYQITLVDETKKITQENLMDYEFTTTVKDDDGKETEEKHKLREFASMEEGESISSISRENQARHLTVSASTKEGYNTTLLSREVQDKLDAYHVAEGYKVEIAGESTQVMEMMEDMLLMILLAVIFIYLIMVAQFQSLLSPFIVIFTLPLAFTGGFLGLLFTGQELSMIAMMGFLILAGVVVNNGIVFVDYVNQLRMEGMDKREALIETGKSRMRPILMTAMTTILAMMTMALSRDASAVISRGMVVVAIGGLAYATIMTLLIVPVMYDILYRRDIKKVDLGDESNWDE